MNDQAPEPDEAREPEHDAEVQEATNMQTLAVAAPIRAQRPSIGPTRLPDNGDVGQWTPAQRAIVEAAGLVFVFPDWHDRAGKKVPAPKPIVERFLAVCRRTGLDPLARQVYCIGRVSKGSIEWSIQTGIDGFRVIAERTGTYRGRAPFEWLNEKRQWVDVFIPGMDGAHPLAARATVYRDGWEHPIVAVAEWNAYAQTKSRGGLTAMWEKQGPGQLAKCAEALALRTAFPQDLSGVYTDDESAGPQAAIDQDRAAELEAEAIDWQEVVDQAKTEADLEVLRARLVERGAPAEAHAAALARLAHLRTQARADEQPVPNRPPAPPLSDDEAAKAARFFGTDPEPPAGDPAWAFTGEPCPVCGQGHDASVHDAEEEQLEQAPAAPVTPAARRARKSFDASAMTTRGPRK